MIVEAGDAYAMYDSYGNPMEATGGRVVVPLDAGGYFLRADPDVRGSFAALLGAIRRARIEGLEPLEIVATDMLAPLGRSPTLRLRLTNQLNRPVAGRLRVDVDGLTLRHPERISFAARQRQWVDVHVTGGSQAADNRYPMAVRFEAGEDGVATHHETMRVNWIARRTVEVDGKLEDWRGALAQVIEPDGEAGPSFEERMWLPFETFGADGRTGVAVGYVAYDDAHFYFAAKVADATPHPGMLRHADSDLDEQFFYPEVSYSVEERRSEQVRLENLPASATFAPRTADGKGRVAHCWQALHEIVVRLDLPQDRPTRVALYFRRPSWHRIRVTDADGKAVLTRRTPKLPDGGYLLLDLSGKVTVRIEPRGAGWGPARGLYGIFLDQGPLPATKPAKPAWAGCDEQTGPDWRGRYGAVGHWLPGFDPGLADGYAIVLPDVIVHQEHRWPEGVRRFSYRKHPELPSSQIKSCGIDRESELTQTPEGQGSLAFA